MPLSVHLSLKCPNFLLPPTATFLPAIGLVDGANRYILLWLLCLPMVAGGRKVSFYEEQATSIFSMYACMCVCVFQGEKGRKANQQTLINVPLPIRKQHCRHTSSQIKRSVSLQTLGKEVCADAQLTRDACVYSSSTKAACEYAFEKVNIISRTVAAENLCDVANSKVRVLHPFSVGSSVSYGWIQNRSPK